MDVPDATKRGGRFRCDDVAVEISGVQGAAIFEGCRSAGIEGMSFLGADEAHGSRRVATGAFAKGRVLGLEESLLLEGASKSRGVRGRRMRRGVYREGRTEG